MIGPKIIPAGTRALVWTPDGRASEVAGPRRVWRIGARVQPLERITAAPDQYLVIRQLDGTTRHEPGPVNVWLNPLVHERIEAAPLLRLNANEAVVVYRPAADGVQRRVERGPALLMPAADEWLHHFSWHGADPHNPRVKRPSALQFEKLRVVPDQLYYDVANVRTADDALITVQLMVFFELRDIERMLEQTHDPIADFINAVTADVLDFAGMLTFERFKERIERLNELATYGQLVRRAEGVGYRIAKVVYRGYEAPGTLQAMHNEAIETRTRLKLQSETERQAQDMEDMKQARIAERERNQHLAEEAAQAHRSRLQAAELSARLEREKAVAAQDARLQRERNALELERRRARDEQKLAFLTGAAGLKVDLTRYLVAHYQHPDRVIRVDGPAAAQLHVHDN